MLRLAGTAVLPRITPDRKYHLGLTVPSAAVMCAGMVITHPEPIPAGFPTFLTAMLVIVLSLLMVSSLQYRNLFHFNFRRRADVFTAMAATIVISACILYPLCFLLLALIAPPLPMSLPKPRLSVQRTLPFLRNWCIT
jgi:phosphatidylserine synthase